jgi:hypothetical protein
LGVSSASQRHDASPEKIADGFRRIAASTVVMREIIVAGLRALRVKLLNRGAGAFM